MYVVVEGQNVGIEGNEEGFAYFRELTKGWTKKISCKIL